MIDFIKKHIFLLAISLFLVIGVVAIILTLTSGEDESAVLEREVVDPDQAPPTMDLEADYSRINEIIPGESTREDVEKIIGRPYTVSTHDVFTYMYYKTPIEFFENVVALRGETVYYALEYVYSDYRGAFSDYTDKYGEPDLVYWSNESEWPWHIFLEEGVAVESSNLQDITGVLYFVPQSEASFYYRIASSPGLDTLALEQQLEQHEEPYTEDFASPEEQ
ncbi:MAG: hypothetical protein WD712_01160 [Candidatus Spechtbacterales bacterium]